MHEIGVREVVTFAGMQFNIQTLEMTWLAMAIVILIAFLATRSLKLVPSGWQNVIEMVIVWLNEQIGVTLGSRGQLVAPFLITLFLFLLISNWIGLIPTLASPTNDLNTTLGLALLVIVMLHVLGLYYKGFNYIKVRTGRAIRNLPTGKKGRYASKGIKIRAVIQPGAPFWQVRLTEWQKKSTGTPFVAGRAGNQIQQQR